MLLRGIWIILIAAVALWLASGFYRVEPDEQGVVLRFGEWTRTTQPGLNYHIPMPIERALTPKVTQENQVAIGFRKATEGRGTSAGRQVPEEALMLTGDENIVDMNFTVFWVIRDAGAFLFNVRSPEEAVRNVSESAMRFVVGQSPSQSVTSENRAQIELDTRTYLQNVLDFYEAGIEVTGLQLERVDPPAPVIDAFRDVQRAKADQERMRNEAEAYRNEIIPQARGQAEQLTQEAEAYKQEVVARAEGDAGRFLSVYKAYQADKDVTVERIYIETLEDVLSKAKKILIDSEGAGAQGVVPYLPLPEIDKARTRPASEGDTQ